MSVMDNTVSDDFKKTRMSFFTLDKNNTVVANNILSRVAKTHIEASNLLKLYNIIMHKFWLPLSVEDT